MKRKSRYLILAALLASQASADTLCFESDKTDSMARTQWSHTWYVVQAGPIMTGPDGKLHRSLFGYGYNDAPAVSGGGDTVPFTGAAVRDIDGRWLVSIVGTLIQTSTDAIFPERSGVLPYWIISQNWRFDPWTTMTGKVKVGNLLSPFNQFAVMHDDGFESDIWRIDCAEVGQ